jgi:hypothetical protein
VSIPPVPALVPGLRWGRVLAVWAVIAVVESVHGTLRQLFLAPLVGDLPARQLSLFTASLLIFLVAWSFASWMDLRGRMAFVLTGLAWVVLTIAFEVALARAMGMPMSRLLQDYDLSQGGLMVFGVAWLACVPWVATTLRRRHAPE